jgi:putative flippase GtrA
VTPDSLIHLIRTRSVVRYACVGGIAACVDIGFFAVFAQQLGYPYLWVAALGFLLATLVNYRLSIVFVFANRRRHKRATEISLVYFVSLLGLGLHQVILYWCVEQAGGRLMVSKLIATGTVFIWNYLTRKYYIFAERPMA